MTDTTEDIEKRTRQLIALRDKVKAKNDAHEADIAPLKQAIAELSGRIEKFMDANNVTNLKTAAGTCYKTTKTTASLADPDAFMSYVIQNRAYDLLDRKANSTAVKAFVLEHKTLPPGCNLSTISTVGVRRAGTTNPEE